MIPSMEVAKHDFRCSPRFIWSMKKPAGVCPIAPSGGGACITLLKIKIQQYA